MQLKRGQITLFIVLGVIIVSAMGIFLYLRSVAVEEEVEAVPLDAAAVSLFMEKCLEETAKDGVLTVSLQGGYYIPPENSFRFLNINIPYYLYEGTLSIPTKEEIEAELSNYVMDNSNRCTNFETFKQKGYDIQAGTIGINTKIATKKVFFDINFPITIKSEDQETTTSDFSTSVDAEFTKLQETALDFIVQQTREPSFFVVPIDLSIENNITFEAFIFENRTIVLSFIDNGTKINNQPLVFSFAIKYLQ